MCTLRYFPLETVVVDYQFLSFNDATAHSHFIHWTEICLLPRPQLFVERSCKTSEVPYKPPKHVSQIRNEQIFVVVVACSSFAKAAVLYFASLTGTGWETWRKQSMALVKNLQFFKLRVPKALQSIRNTVGPVWNRSEDILKRRRLHPNKMERTTTIQSHVSHLLLSGRSPGSSFTQMALSWTCTGRDGIWRLVRLVHVRLFLFSNAPS